MPIANTREILAALNDSGTMDSDDFFVSRNDTVALDALLDSDRY